VSEVTTPLVDEVDFSIIRYAQCWEDTDVVLGALQTQPGDVCLSIASAGDNTLSLLTADPARVIAIDLSPSQLACLELRVAAFRHLSHAELLELLGARPGNQRKRLFDQLLGEMSDTSREIWLAQGEAVESGVGNVGRFEQYLNTIRRFAVNPTHSAEVREALFDSRPLHARKAFYDREWNNWRWRMLIRLACSRFVMGRLGRDPRFFRYASGSVADHIMGMAEHALVDLEPADNPYLRWIVEGCFGRELPHYLRAENFESIRANLDRLEWHLADLKSWLDGADAQSVQRFNLSDVFEYLSEADSDAVFDAIARVGAPGARLAYWNMLVPRHRPEHLADRIVPLSDLSETLHQAARTFFYTDFVVEELSE
jgi:S-adenosylmethionine-diacylglycerol 3-amino-3-carboxypropyl transferase